MSEIGRLKEAAATFGSGDWTIPADRLVDMCDALLLAERAFVARCSCHDDNDSEEAVPEYPCGRCAQEDLFLDAIAKLKGGS